LSGPAMTVTMTVLTLAQLVSPLAK
jgi:hypothetical protein